MNHKARRFWQRPTSWLMLPAVVLVAVAAWITTVQLNASSSVAAELEALRAAGLPVNDEMAASQFRAATHSENTQAWASVIALLGNSWGGSLAADLPYVGSGKLPARLDPDADWENKEEIADYLDHIAPVIEQTHELADYPTPVWQPIEFDGYSTLLQPIQEARVINRVLALDCEYALHQQDTARALRDLQTMKRSAQAFDWDIFVTCKLLTIAYEYEYQHIILRSLYSAQWSEEQLEQIRQIIGGPTDWSKVWPRLIGSERAMTLAHIREQNQSDRFDTTIERILSMALSVPTAQLAFIRESQKWENIASNGLGTMVARSETLQHADHARTAESKFINFENLLHNTLGNWYPSVAAAIVRSEDRRRLALTAVAIKQFHLKQQRWPNSLSELKHVALTEADWTTVTAGSFGWKTKDDIFYLWTYRTNLDETVPRTMPEPNTSEQSPPDYDMEIVSIR